MKIPFNKGYLPIIDRAAMNRRDADAQYDMYLKLRMMDGFDRQISLEMLLLERGAHEGNVLSMCELARVYFYEGGKHTLPISMSWWQKAMKHGSEFARADFENNKDYILRRILTYSDMPTKFNNLVMRCALISEWCLTDMGRVDWATLDSASKKRRIYDLTARACELLSLPSVQVSIVPNLTFTYPDGNTVIARGVAHPSGRIDINEELLSDLPTLIAVLFHELGHHVCFTILGNPDLKRSFMETYGITDERIESWGRGDMGIEVPTSEEDPDTLSYNVYTYWSLLFL